MSPGERRLGRIVPPPGWGLLSRTGQLALVVAHYRACIYNRRVSTGLCVWVRRDSVETPIRIRDTHMARLSAADGVPEDLLFHGFRSGASLRESD
jgi:hypothetical protein